MSHPQLLSSLAYTYPLPDEKIALHPLAERDQSKLLIYQHHMIREDIYLNLSRYLPDGTLLVFNNSKVIPARILFQKPSGGVIEIFLLDPEEKGMYAGLGKENRGLLKWKCLIGGAGKWKQGQLMQKEVTIEGAPAKLTARIADRKPGCFVIEFSWEPARWSFLQVLEIAGTIPIPPYLKRQAGAADADRYQTVYASEQGSVAAPTAGLHFTERVFQSLAGKGIGVAFTTLHVGAGTFVPLKSATLEGHVMHAEWMTVERHFIQQLILHPGGVVAIGTTSLRTMESLYWMGVKCLADPEISPDRLAIGQWDPYEGNGCGDADAKTALQALLQWLAGHGLETLTTETRLLIAPPYRPRIAGGLVTNFHQPASTLLLLVAAVTGGEWKRMYAYALQHDFRFLSYGDGCLILFD